MKKYLFILLIVLLTGGCNSSTPTLTPPPTNTETKVIPSTTIVPSKTHTQTLTPTITSTATITLSPTITPTATMTLAPTATFSPQKQITFMLNLIRNNGGCELPCLWGLIPGESTTNDYLEKLEPLKESINDYYLGFSEFVYLYPVVESRRAEILVLSIHAENYDSNGYHIGPNWQVYNAMETYSIPNVFSDLGVPSRILIGANLEELTVAGSFPFGLAIFYEDLGVLIFYEGPTIFSTPDDIVKHCFRYSKTISMRMYLHSPEDGRSLKKVVDRTFGTDKTGVIQNMVKNGVFHDVEDATGVSIEEFYEMYKNPISRCLESSIDIWGR